MRSEEEIKKQVEAGKKFTDKHPRTIFGGDNVKDFQIFEKLIEKAKRGETVDELYDFADDAYIDSDEHSHAFAVIEWLFEDGDKIYSEDE